MACEYMPQKATLAVVEQAVAIITKYSDQGLFRSLRLPRKSLQGIFLPQVPST
jgi:hypothetical protein